MSHQFQSGFSPALPRCHPSDGAEQIVFPREDFFFHDKEEMGRGAMTPKQEASRWFEHQPSHLAKALVPGVGHQ